ncbi:MAG: NAD-dependent epimerase/dehydratase family protein [Ruminococcaceae bacterium]|nr:NAD-dependent epimerase/dehydratase family protein [Oscillospiraceae bacterium]
MKFLVFGCNGMAGHTISLYLKEQGHEVFGFDLKESNLIDSISGNATNVDLVREIVKSGKYDAVINCIGLLNQFAENNRALAAFLNGYFPHFLAEITRDMKTQIIHMSTDCVFSGKKGQYTETDLRDGETFYDRSKALGELDDDKNITLRNSIIGPDINPNGIGLMNWFMQQSGKINGFTKAIWTGQTTLQLAKTMEAAAKSKATGLYNAVPSSSITKYDLLCLLNKYMRNNSLEIAAVEGVNLDKSLKRTRFDFDYIIPDYEIMISELSEWTKKHNNLYTHYCL